MRYNLLGRSGLAVSELCLGTMTFGGGEGMWRKIGQVQQDEAARGTAQRVDPGDRLLTAVATLVEVHGAAEQSHLVRDRPVIGVEADAWNSGGDAQRFPGPQAGRWPPAFRRRREFVPRNDGGCQPGETDHGEVRPRGHLHA